MLRLSGHTFSAIAVQYDVTAPKALVAAVSVTIDGVWRPVRERTPTRRGRRRERDAIHCNSKELRGMDSTPPHLKDSQELILDALESLTRLSRLNSF